MQNPTRCEICKVDIPNKDSWTLHLLGKKHRRVVELLEQKKDAEEKGIYVRGLSNFVFSLYYVNEYSVKIGKCIQISK